MRRVDVGGIALFYNEEDMEALEPVRQACEKSIKLMQTHWNMDVPNDCRVYIMTSWSEFMFHAATWPWKVLLVVSMPLWVVRVKKTWPLAGGWAQKFGNRRVVGVKPPHLLQLADRKMGDQIFVSWDDLNKHVQSITCHELTHAFTAHLHLPSWLNEGLAMVMVDKFFEKQTVWQETLELIDRFSDPPNLRGRRKPRVEDQDALLYLYVRGYWLTRYIEETKPGLLGAFLSHRHRRGELERNLATAYGKSVEGFWREIDSILVSHFR